MNFKLTKDVGFNFDPASHIYTIDGKRLKNATSIVDKYCKPFDPKYALRSISKKTNKPERIIRKTWQANGDKSRAFGDYIHNSALQYWLDPTGHKKGVRGPHDLVIERFMEEFKSKYVIADMETPRGSSYYNIGYTMDIFGYKDGFVKEYIIADIKTADYLNNEQYKDAKKRNAQLMLEPFKSYGLRDVALDKAIVQLSIYGLAFASDPAQNYFDEADLPDVRRIVIHVPKDINRYNGNGYAFYEIEPLDNIVQQLLYENMD